MEAKQENETTTHYQAAYASEAKATIAVRQFQDKVGSPLPASLRDRLKHNSEVTDWLGSVATNVLQQSKSLDFLRTSTGDHSGLALRAKLMTEELGETLQAMSSGDEVAMADGLADLLYVLLGTAITLDIPIDAVFNEVHKSNLTKSTAQESVANSVGDRGKGDAYSPPDIVKAISKARTMRIKLAEQTHTPLTKVRRLMQRWLMAIEFGDNLARLSHATIRQVGCVLYSPDMREVLGIGYNGQGEGISHSHSGADNNKSTGDVHAEVNVLMKATNVRKGVMYITAPPCVPCAGAIINSHKVSMLIVGNDPAPLSGLERLSEAGIYIVQKQIVEDAASGDSESTVRGFLATVERLVEQWK